MTSYQEGFSLTLETLSKKLAGEGFTHTILADRTSVLLSVESMRVLSLNETGTFLAKAIREGARTEADLVAELQREFEVDEATARRDVAEFVVDLSRYLES
ncbi:MAG: PqqD family protein [Acidobacteriota bacterium]|jgi:hypothetical protein